MQSNSGQFASAEFIMKLHNQLRSMAAGLNVSRESAEDLVQEMWEEVFKNPVLLNKVQRMENPVPFLLGIIKNLNRMRYRREQSLLRYCSLYPREEIYYDNTELRMTIDMIMEVIDNHRDGWILKEILKGKRPDEIARISGRKPAWVRNRLSRLRKKVRSGSGL